VLKSAASETLVAVYLCCSISAPYRTVISPCAIRIFDPALVTHEQGFLTIACRLLGIYSPYISVGMTLKSETAIKGLGCSSSKRGMTEEGDTADSRTVRITTPPPAPERIRLDARSIAETNSNRRSKPNTRHSDGSHSGALDNEPFESSLFRELHRPQRESTPSASPHRKRQRINGDRYAVTPVIPSSDD
jgi:hypothetical protein